MSNNKTTLLEGKLLAKNSVYSFIGMIVPMAVGVITIPFLLMELGEEQFGLLILVWSTISYITLLDFGINRATTKYFSQNIGRLNEPENLSLLVSSSIFLVLVGVIIGVGLYFGAEFIASKIFQANDSLRIVAIYCFRLISFYSPALLLISALGSFLKSYQNFKWLSIINSINGILNYVIPALAIFFSFSLTEIIKTLLILKGVILVSLMIVSYKVFNIGKFSFLEIKVVKSFRTLITFGGWVSVSNFLAPLFEYSDRFIIASYITISAVTIYATPLEIVLKIGMIAAAISGVIYAAISNSIEHDIEKTEKILNNGLAVITLLTYPIICTLILFADEGLTLWVGEEISLQGTLILQIVAIGILFKCSTNLSIAYLHSVNKPQITANIHVLEFILYIISLVLMAHYFGLIGIAVAHSGRLILDNIVMSYFAQKNSQKMKINFIQNSKFVCLLALVTIPVFFIESFTVKASLWLIMVIIYLFYISTKYDRIRRLMGK